MFRPLNPRPTLCAAFLLLTAFCAAFSIGISPARAELSETILHEFDSPGTATSDGLFANSKLTQTSDGTLYGTTSAGGSAGLGTVYAYTVGGKYGIVHNFGDGSVASDGAHPGAALTLGPDGNLYGTTAMGGAFNYGTVYKLAPSGAVTILHSFQSGRDGSGPESSVTVGTDGKLYGTTLFDMSSSSASGSIRGTIYSLNLDGTGYLVQYRFTKTKADATGDYAYGTLTPAGGSSPILYGTTAFSSGGLNSAPSLFAFTPGATDGSGTVRVIHSFTGAPDGAEPVEGRVAIDRSGNIIGVTSAGGTYGAGIIFTCAPDGSEYRILHEFGDSAHSDDDGASPIDGLTLGSDGAYYGVTSNGGDGADGTGGVVYRFVPENPTGNFSVLYNFNGTGDGYVPVAKPFEDSDGNLIGTTLYTNTMDNGDARGGVLYKLASGLPNPVKVASLTLSPGTVIGGQMNSTAAITLNKPAGSNGAMLEIFAGKLNSSGSDNAASVPTSITIPAGHETATFTVATSAVNSTTDEQIAAGYNATSGIATLIINPASGNPSLKSVVLSPTSITGGASTTANRVHLYGNATAVTAVALTSSDPSVATVPSTVTVQAGYSSHLFTVNTKAVTSMKTVTITATSGLVTQTTILTVTP